MMSHDHSSAAADTAVALTQDPGLASGSQTFVTLLYGIQRYKIKLRKNPQGTLRIMQVWQVCRTGASLQQGTLRIMQVWQVCAMTLADTT
jgi:hypothetical protein